MARLGDICTFQSGGTPSKTVPAYYQGNIPWITTVSLTGGRISNEDAIEYITDQAIRESAAKIVPQNSIMVGTRVGVGKVAINTVPMSTSQDIISLLNIDESTWNKDFLCKFIAAKSAYLNSQARGATIKGIKIETLASLDLPEITLEEQKHISRVIDEVLQLVKYRKDQLNELDQLVKSRFIELFGAIPDSKHTTVTDVCSIITDGTHQPPKFTSSGIPFLFVSNIVTNKITYKTEKHISEETYAELIKRTPIEIGDILLSTVGSYGHPAVVETDERFCFQRHIAYLKPKKDVVNSRYLYGVLLSADVQKQIEEKVKGIAQKTLNLSEIKKLHFPLPSLELQNEFASFVEHTDKLKFAVQNAVYLQITLILNLVNHPWEHWASVSNKGVKL